MPPAPTDKANVVSAAPGKRLKQATLLYRTDSQQPPKEARLKTEDGFVYSAEIPAADLKGGRWLEYAFKATDDTGRAARLPSGTAHPWFYARLTADENPPEITHTPIRKCKAGKPLTVEAKVHDPDGVSAVRVHYRTLDESLPYESILLQQRGDKYVGEIPAEAVRADFDLVYFLEAIDEAGTGCFYPDWTKTAPYIIVPTEK
jgi:hypothetical protein